MSRIETKTYYWCCDKCNTVKIDDEDELPYGWEANEDGEDICEDCLLNKELSLDLDESVFDD